MTKQGTGPVTMATRSSREGVWARRAIAIVYGVACHTLFALGVATMIATMYFGMSRSLGRVPPPWSIVANAGLLLQFPLAHSLLLSGTGRKFLGMLAPRRLGGRMCTTTYAIVASLQVFLLFAFWTPSGTVWWRAEGATLLAISCLYAAAWFLLLKAIWDAGLALQIGFLGWWAILRGPRAGLPAHADGRVVPSSGNRSMSPSR